MVSHRAFRIEVTMQIRWYRKVSLLCVFGGAVLGLLMSVGMTDTFAAETKKAQTTSASKAKKTSKSKTAAKKAPAKAKPAAKTPAATDTKASSAAGTAAVAGAAAAGAAVVATDAAQDKEAQAADAKPAEQAADGKSADVKEEAKKAEPVGKKIEPDATKVESEGKKVEPEAKKVEPVGKKIEPTPVAAPKAKSTDPKEQAIETALHAVGKKLVHMAATHVMPNVNKREVVKGGSGFISRYQMVDETTLNVSMQASPSLKGQYVGFIRYVERSYECSGKTKAEAQKAAESDCQMLKLRRVRELVRYDGKEWRY